jgi:hypothetical protein
MEHAILVKIVENHLRNGNICKLHKREVYELIKRYIKQEKIEKCHFNIKKVGDNKELTIVANILPDEILVNILDISNYEF